MCVFGGGLVVEVQGGVEGGGLTVKVGVDCGGAQTTGISWAV